jgi:hypothetical protein
MAALTLVDLVQNRTMSPEIAATLAVAAEERRSLLFVAIPRMAGKSTTMQATLQYAPRGTAFHQLTRAAGPSLGIPASPDSGYLVLSEISGAGFADYLWGDDVRQAFESLAAGGFSLATALHAGSVEEAFDVITRQNRVPDEHAARIDLMVYIRSIGHWAQPVRRAVAGVYEVNGVEDGQPAARLLHRWDEAADRFEVVLPPLRIGSETATFDQRRAEFSQAAAGMATPPARPRP